MTNLPDPADEAAPDTDEGGAFDAAFAEFAEGEGDPSTPDPLNENKSWGNHEQRSIDNGHAAAVTSDPTSAVPAARPTEDAAARARIAELEHQRRSDQGRLWVLQRRLMEHQQHQAASPEAAHKTQGRQTGGIDGTGAVPQDHAPSGDDPLAALMDDYPEVGRPVAQLLSSLRQQNAALSGRLAELDAREADDLLARNEAALAGTHPDWQDAVTQPSFMGWLVAQPAYVQQAAQRNGERIVDPAEAADIIGRFKAAHAAPPTFSAPTPAGMAPVPAGGVPATLAARRSRQLDAGASVRSRATGATGGPPEDFDAAFTYYAGRNP